jgi:hypothetical protein
MIFTGKCKAKFRWAFGNGEGLQFLESTAMK